MLFKASCGILALALSQAALAEPHHATPTAWAVCDASGDWLIEYSAITWIQPPTPENCQDQGFNGDSCGNPDIGVFTYDNANDAINLIENGVPSPGFPDCDATGNPNLQAIQSLESPTYAISGRFLSPTQTPGDTVWLATKPLAPWDDGRAPACVNKQTVGDYRATSVTIPSGPCIPANSHACSGFYPPMEDYPVKAKKNRVFPLKMELFDRDEYEMGSNELIAPPVVEVIFTPSGGGDPVDMSDEALSAGLGMEGNQFVYTEDGIWQFNLKSKNYSAPGDYVVTAISGDSSEYTIDPACVTSFRIE